MGSVLRQKMTFLQPMLSNSAAVTVQPATLADIPTIVNLAEATWEPTYRFIISKDQLEYMYRVIYTPASLQRQMSEQGHEFLLLYCEGRPSGFASYSAKEQGTYHLNKIYLLPSHQGQGLGQQLIKAVEDIIRTAGGTALELNVNRYNPAIAFYERQGFQRQREEDVPIGPFWMNDYVMRKELL